MGQFLVNIIASVITGVSAATIAFNLFLAQRKWDQKNEAYKKLLEALQDMKSVVDDLLADEIAGTYDFDNERTKDLFARWRANRITVYRYADIGQFDTSLQVETIIATLRKALENKERRQLVEQLDHEQVAIKQALADVKSIAVSDLGRKRWRLRSRVNGVGIKGSLS